MFKKTVKFLTILIIILFSGSCLQLGSSQASPSPDASETNLEWTHLSSADGDLPEPGSSTEQTAALILEINNDGLLDFVIASRKSPGPSMVWYQRDSDGWTRHIIDNSVLDIEAGGTYHDIDADGDLDIVMGGDYRSNKVWWWENPYPNYGSTWTRREIKNTGSNQHHDQIFGDFDGDGKAELVFWNQGARSLFLADIPSDPLNTQPWPYTSIYNYSGSEHEGLAKADIDVDGVLDIVGGGRWFKHTGGNNYASNVVDDGKPFTRAAAGQLKAGGRPEIVFVVGDGTGPLDWYEWNGSNWIKNNLLNDDVDHGHSLDVADFDGDGNLDIFVAEMRLNGGNPDAKMWVFQGDGQGNFIETQVANGIGNHESKVGDLDGDGDLDILGKPYNWDTPRVDIWLNKLLSGGTSLDQWQRHVIDNDRPWRSLFIAAADIDGDNLKDIITGGWWYKNPGDELTDTWTRYEVGSPLNNMATVHDFDNDNKPDILGTTGQGSNPSDTFVWGRNNGSGGFTILNNISNGDGDFLQGATVDRFQDGNLAVALSWHAENKGVQLLTIPSDPQNETWPWSLVSSVSQDEGLSSGDIDKDGDPDLLLGTKWLRNEGEGWTAFDLYLPNGMPDRNRLVDINGDGNLDTVVGYEAISELGKLAWYEYEGSVTGLWTEHIIANPAIIGPMSLDVADMDADGDLDVVVGEHNTSSPSSANLFVFENINGDGLAWERHLVYTGDEHHDGAQVVDIDNDGDLDIISIGWTHNRVLLYENKSSGENPPITHPHQQFLPAINHSSTTNIGYQCIVDQNLLASYHFNEDKGGVIHDTSGVEPDLDLFIIDGNTHWLAGGGLSINTPTLIASSNGAQKVNEAIKQSNQFTIEAWIKPGNIEQDGPARIVTLSSDTQHRNFTLGQGLWGDQPSELYDIRLRTTETDDNGQPSFTTQDGSAKIELSHLAYVRQENGNSIFYINGLLVASEQIYGNLSNWNNSYRLALANELSGDRPWLGELYHVAIYDCALSADDIMENFDAGWLASTVPSSEPSHTYHTNHKYVR